LQEAEGRRSRSKAGLDKWETLSEKQTKSKRTGSVAQEVKCLVYKAKFDLLDSQKEVGRERRRKRSASRVTECFEEGDSDRRDH
jgi:hypothetical protein